MKKWLPLAMLVLAAGNVFAAAPNFVFILAGD